jgi:SSS family solute:Na+ symporter
MMVYILVGGMRSVALADVIQGSLLLTGMLVAGFVAISALGGVREYFASLAKLPPEALSLPGATGRFTAWGMMTLIVFASLASMIQPAQWMRYYAARSTQALKRTALIFSILLPICYLFGVMLVGLGARALYPPTVVTTEVGAEIRGHAEVEQADQALIAVLRNHGPEVLGPAGAIIVAVIMIAILAASMSTADSNLHALSAVLTRDVYDRFLRPKASQRERAWVGRIVIVAAALLALALVQIGEHKKEFAPLKMIVEMQIVAMAFSCQVLPVTIDMLFIRRGTRAGAVCGMLAGLIVVLLFTPVPGLLLGRGLGVEVASAANYLKRLLDVSCWGFVVNTAVFVLVSAVTRRPDPKRVAEMARIMQRDNG